MGKYIRTLLFIIVILGFNLFFNLRVASLPFVRTQAKDFVVEQLENEIEGKIDQDFPDLAKNVKQEAVAELLAKRLKEDKDLIAQKTKDKEIELASYWHDHLGDPYLHAFDPYHWLRLVKIHLAQGSISDQVSDHGERDSFMLAPVGMQVKASLHKNLLVYLNVHFFKLIKSFKQDVSLIQFLFYSPLFVSCFVLILVFLICFSLGGYKDNLSGFFAALSLGFSPVFLDRIRVGRLDTDGYVVLFSCLVLWFFYLSLSDHSLVKRNYFFSLLSSLFVGLFALAWDGWWYVFYLIIISALFYQFYLYLLKIYTRERVNFNIHLSTLSLFIICSIIFVGLFAGRSQLVNLFSGPIRLLLANASLSTQFWPNAFLTVSELKTTNFQYVLSTIGGLVIFIPAVLYLVLALVPKGFKLRREQQFFTFLFAIWTLIMLLAAKQAVRFSLLLIIPISLSFGLFIGKAVNYLMNIFSFERKRSAIMKVIFVVFCIFFMLSSFRSAFSVTELTRYAEKKRPILFNKDWDSFCKEIQSSTPEDAIINTWWDYGHWIKAMAERRVLFDNATQNTAIAYWMGRALLSDNQKESLGILRMLNSGSNQAFERLKKLGISKKDCLSILNEIILLDEDQAFKRLAKYVTRRKDRRRVLALTHQPQKAFFFAPSSFIWTVKNVALVGGWDFKRAQIYRKYTQFSADQFIEYLINSHGYDFDLAEKVQQRLRFLNKRTALNWIAPLLRVGKRLDKVMQKDEMAFFEQGFVVNLDDYSVYHDNKKENKWQIPESIFYFEADQLKEIEFEDSSLDFSVLLFQEEDEYYLITLSKDMARSMLVRLCLLNGRGLDGFRPVVTQQIEDDAGKLTLYEIDWSGI